jgi:hypothetical protein
MKTIKTALLITLLVISNRGYAEQWSDPTEIKDLNNNIRSAEANYSSCLERAITSHKKPWPDDVETATNSILQQCDGELTSIKQAAEAANMHSPASNRISQMNRNRGELEVRRALYYERAKQTQTIQ